MLGSSRLFGAVFKVAYVALGLTVGWQPFGGLAQAAALQLGGLANASSASNISDFSNISAALSSAPSMLIPMTVIPMPAPCATPVSSCVQLEQ